MFKFETKKDRRIRELEEENQSLLDESVEQEKRLSELASTLEKTLNALNQAKAKEVRSAFAAEIGLLPCESPACQYCKNAVWQSGADGRHIAGCRKGIQCADFEEAKPEETKPSTPAALTAPYLPSLLAQISALSQCHTGGAYYT